MTEQQTAQTSACPKCRETILAGAKKCKHCGADLRNWFVRHKILTGILVLILLGIIGNVMNGDTGAPGSNSPITPQAEAEQAIAITARELYAQYEANEIQADALYKNKTLAVSGTIQNIGKDILDDPYISFKTDNLIGSVQCMLADTEKEKAAQLREGTAITLQGKNSGKLMNVLLRNCVIRE